MAQARVRLNSWKKYLSYSGSNMNSRPKSKFRLPWNFGETPCLQMNPAETQAVSEDVVNRHLWILYPTFSMTWDPKRYPALAELRTRQPFYPRIREKGYCQAVSHLEPPFDYVLRQSSLPPRMRPSGIHINAECDQNIPLMALNPHPMTPGILNTANALMS